MSTSKVEVVDLRSAPGDLPARLAGGVVVLDDADSLVKHAEMYLSLVSDEMVSAIVCVAIGEAGQDDPLDGAVLNLPPALRHATVLWVGDPNGVGWVPEKAHPSPIDTSNPPGEALDDLIAVLRVPRLFDRVVDMVENSVGAAVSPAVRVVSVAPSPAELAEAGTAAIRSLRVADEETIQNLGPVIRQLDSAHDLRGTAISGPIDKAKADAVRGLAHISELARTLGSWQSLIGHRRPARQLGEEVARASRLAETYRRCLTELVDRIDGHLQVGSPPVEKITELGVQEPKAARVSEIAAGLRRVVDARIEQGASFAAVAREVRHASASSGPQGCATTLAALRRREPLTLGTPGFSRWPVSLKALPVVVVTCALATILLGAGPAGWFGGGLLAVGWWSAGWLLLARSPGASDERGFAATWVPALGTCGIAAVAGVVGGAFAAAPVHEWLLIPELTGAALTVAVMVLSAVVVALSWRAAVCVWHAALPLSNMLADIDDMTRLAEETVFRDWLPMRRHRAIASAAEEVGNALDEVSRALDGSGGLFVEEMAGPVTGSDPPRGVRPAPHELLGVVRRDVAGICRTALDQVWPAVEVGRRTTPGIFEQRTDHQLRDYDDRVRHRGLLDADGEDHDAGRKKYLARVWSDSPDAAVALNTDPSTEMTQLCRSDQIRYLTTSIQPTLLRFAPQGLRPVFERNGTNQRHVVDSGITWSGGELVGALRLVPLRPESVRHVMGGGR